MQEKFCLTILFVNFDQEKKVFLSLAKKTIHQRVVKVVITNRKEC